MTPSRRWWLVAATCVLVIGAPLVARALPVSAPDPAAAALLSQIRSAADHAYSGTVETAGNLDLPVTARFTDVGDLLGGRTTLRVWWRSSEDWRVDKLLVTGETDLIHYLSITTQWRYEGSRVIRSIDPEVRLPRTDDLLPPALARRVVQEADPASVTRLPARRVAGRGAVGLRVKPSSAQSGISHVDLWADPDSGVVLRLDVYAVGEGDVSFSTRFTDFSAAEPARATTWFTTPRGANVSFDNVLDIADAANQYAPFDPPNAVAGLQRAPRPAGGVGIYGTGLTRILVIPLRHGDADTLRRQLRATPGVTMTDYGLSLRAGPLGVLVAEGRRSDWLVSGLVRDDGLVQAAADLIAGARRR
jgi:hypothetical protein